MIKIILLLLCLTSLCFAGFTQNVTVEGRIDGFDKEKVLILTHSGYSYVPISAFEKGTKLRINDPVRVVINIKELVDYNRKNIALLKHANKLRKR